MEYNKLKKDNMRTIISLLFLFFCVTLFSQTQISQDNFEVLMKFDCFGFL